MGELALPLITDEGELSFYPQPPLPPPIPFPPAAGGSPGPGVMTAGELSLSLTRCSTQKAGPAPCQGSTVEMSLVGRGVGVGKLAPPAVCCAVAWARERCPNFYPLPFKVGRKADPRVMRAEEPALAPHQLQHWKRALHLT